MPTLEIPRSQWTDFFKGFSREHEGRLVTLEVLGRDLGAQVEADEMALVGVSSDATENTIWVALARDRDSHLTHGVHQVTHLRVEEDEEGSPDVLQIETSEGVTTLLRVRAT
jgi:hypothetical protein